MATATTPPPRERRAHTPPTPRHGALSEDWHPFTPRRSSRVAAQKSKEDPASTTLRNSAAFSHHTTSPPPSTPHSPLSSFSQSRRHKRPSAGPLPRQRRARPASPASSDSESQLLPQSSSLAVPSQAMESARDDPFMLPTPAKTPMKKKRTKGSFAGTSRQLFTTRLVTAEDAMPTPKKPRKTKAKSYYDSLLGENEQEDGFEIYEDWQDRVAQVDTSPENPFMTRSSEAIVDEQAAQHLPKSEKDSRIEEAAKRGEGLVYVFRGKKTLVRFDDNDGEDTLSDLEMQRNTGVRRIRRSNIKPRRLFQEEQGIATEPVFESAAEEADEEALTDIEMPSPTPAKKSAPAPRKRPTIKRGRKPKDAATEEDVEMPQVQEANSLDTADRSRSLFTPPAQIRGRTAEISNKALERTKDDRARSTSPFLGWTRVKRSNASSSATSNGQQEAIPDAVAGLSGATKRNASPIPRTSKRARFSNGSVDT